MIRHIFFHAIDTVLSMYGVAFKRHKDTLGHFNKNYIVAGLFPRDLGRRIVKAEEIRHNSDYDPFYVASRDVTKQQIETAENLIGLVSKYYEDHKNEIEEWRVKALPRFCPNQKGKSVENRGLHHLVD